MIRFKQLLILVLTIGLSNTTFSQVCDILEPICTSQDGLNNTASDPSPIPIIGTCVSLTGNRVAWYSILIDEVSVFTFQIEPTTPNDYDFAVWLNADCNNMGTPLRTNWSGTPGNTGLSVGAGNTCQGGGGSNQSDPINVVPGDEIIIAVDRFSASFNMFDLTFGDPDALDCSIVGSQLCEGDTETLDATDPLATNYEWSFDDGMGGGPVIIFDGPGFNTIDVVDSGFYECIISLPSGATNTEQFDVVFNPFPVITNPGDQEECESYTLPDIATLVTDAYSPEYRTASQGAGGGAVIPNMSIINTTQTVWIFDTSGAPSNCSDEESFLVTINPLPDATINDPEVCVGTTTAPFTPTITSGTPTAYYIDYDAAAEAQGFTDVADAMTPATLTGANFVIPAAAAVGVYNGTFTFVDGNGCERDDVFTITLNDTPIATVNSPEACPMTASIPILFTVTQGNPVTYTIDYDDPSFTDITTDTPIANANYMIPAGTPVGMYTGTITYEDASGCSGTATFTITLDYLLAGSPDSDGDGISNACDLDDDNDGIQDCDETDIATLFAFNGDASQINNTEFRITPNANGSSGTAFAQDLIDFTDDFTIEFEANLGTNDANGADGVAIVFHNDPAGTNALGTLGAGLGAEGIQNGIVLELDTFNNPPAGDIANDHGMIWDSDNQAGAGLLTPAVDLGNIEDGNYHPIVVNWSATTQTLSYTVDGINAGTFTFTDISANYFGGASQLFFGFTGSTGGFSNLHLIRFAELCIFDPDFDEDGIPNSLDLDSDNDGIYDTQEAGLEAFDTDNNGTLDAMDTPATGDTDNDGVADVVGVVVPRETTPGIFDFLNLDSDGDGCSDANEGYNDITSEDPGGQEYGDADNAVFGDGSGIIDANGVVTTATYAIPADANGNGIQDYLEETTITAITTQPVDVNLAPIGSTQTFDVDFSSNATTADFDIQWQLDDGSGAGFVDLVEAAPYSGVNTLTLTITGVTVAMNGHLFRAVITNPANVCDTTPFVSNNAILSLMLFDFGDAPDTYATNLTDDAGEGVGPSHIIINGFNLGNTIDNEFDGQPSIDATGDGADEDGIVFPNVPIGENTTLNFVVNEPTVGTGRLSLWIDWNRDGDYLDADEQVLNDIINNSAADSDPSTTAIAVDIFNSCEATDGITFARVRWTSDAAISYNGPASDGEVEDYELILEPVDMAIPALDATICSDVASGIILSTTGNVTAATYNITAINFNGLIASAGTPLIADGLLANEIVDDAYTNTTNAPVNVVYTVVPVSAEGCEGLPRDITLTVNPEPVLDPMLDATVCSDTATGVILNTNGTSIGALSYNIIAINQNGLIASAGMPATGTGFPDTEISDDAFTNTTGADVIVTYTIAPVSGDGCIGDEVVVNITIQPEPVGDGTTSNQEICTTETLGIDLNTTVSLPSTFTWEAVDNPDVMGETLTPGSTSSVIDDTLTNTSVTDTTVEYIIIPTASGAANCTGDPYSIFVTVVATPVHDAIADQEECDTFTFPAITQMGVVRPNAYFSLNADGTGDQFAQGETITYFDFFPNQYPVTIYTYEVTGGMAACENPVNTFTLTIVRSPQATVPAEYPLCDDGADDTEIYDLTSRNAEVLGTLDPATHSVIWFENAADANDQTAVSTIPDDTMHIFNADFPLTDPPTQVVYARVTETSSGIDCFDVVPLTLVLNPNPVLFDDMATFEVCDDNIPDGIVIVDLSVNDQDIAGPNTPADVTVSYHETPQDAVDGTNAVDKFNYQTLPPPYPYTLYTRVTDNITGCHSEGELAITVLQSPAVVAPTPYELCDLDNDGVATFMLSTKNDEIFAGDPTLTIAYYLTQAEAEADPANPANALDQSAYTNATPFSETVWARVENAAGCVTVVPVDLIVLDTPMPNDTPADYALCDFDQDGQEVFDLPSRNMDVLGGLDPVGYSVTWYADLTNAQNGTPDIPDATNYASTGGDVYAVVRDETQSATTFCEAIVTLTLVVEPIPVPVQPVAYELCDDEASGSTTDDTSIFDLTTREPIIIDGNTDWDVTWYTTEVGADTADPAALIPNPTMYSYTNMMVNVPVWARVADTSTQNSCHATVSLTLVVQPNPSPSAIPDVEECDGNDGILDGQATFDLTDEAIAIANGEMVVITFHETEQNAIDNMDAINEMAYTSGTRTLWARSTEDDPATATECFTIVAINLIVRDTPEITATMADLELTACDDADGTMDGTATFDLTVNDALIYGTLNPADYDLTYHESQVSAEADLGDPDYNIDIIATPAAYTFGPPATGTVWVRLQDTTQPNTLCAAVTSFTINVGATPVYTVPEPEYFACDSLDSGDDMDGIATFDLTLITADITASNPDLTVAYYASPADIPLGNDIQPQDAYQGTGADPQTITIVITSTQAGMCEVIESTDLRVNPVPQLISDPLPEAIACDPDNDDFSDFDLDAYALLIVNGQTGIDILFYETLAAAENGDPADAIVNTASYDNIVPNQVLYALATDTNNATACAKIFPFTLLSHPTPLVTPGTVDDLTDCDDDGDGQEVFDLTVQDGPLLAIQTPANDPAAFTVSYHNTQASADDITDPGVPDAANYPVTVVGSPETIFVRVRFNDGSDCFSTTSFDVIVDPLPVIGAYTNDLEVCDDDIDQIAVFDLTTNEDEITVDPLLQVDYYETMADITAGTPIVDPTMFTNTTNPQTIFVVVTSQAGCTVQTQRELRVLPLPSPDEPNPEDVVVCDDDFDGFFDFDLTPTVNEIDPASAPTIIRIFETLAQAESYDAITNTPAPATDAAAGYLYTNTVPNGQTLYARVDHDPAIVMGNTCAVIVEFDVIINPLPVVNPDRTDPYVFCEQEDGDDSMGDLILENIASEIALLQAPQVEGDFFITYHEDQSQATSDDFALNSPYTFDENVFTGLWIRIENRVTGCFVVEFLAIVVEARPVAQQPEDLMVCEDIVPDDVNGIPTPGTATIDLTVQDEIIFGGPLGPTDQVNYFTSLADANLNMNAIVDPVNFINTTDPQTIWAVVEDTTTSCPSSPPVSFAIDVKEVPYTDLSDTGGEICVDPLTGEVLNPIVLDGTPETLVAGALYTYEWRLDGTLVSIDPTVTVSQVGTYEVTVTATYTDPITAMVHQCTYVADTFFTPVSAPLFQVEVVEDAFNPGGLYTVEVIAESITGFGVSEYEFAIDDGPFQDGLVFTNVRPGTHTVFGRRVDGNCSETPVEIGIIDYPRFFTPNADGFHDTWNILGIGTAPNLNAKIYIFDRYGKLLKQLSPTSPGWNGTFNGQPMPSNDYWFRVEYNEIDDEGELVNKEFSGHFALKR